MNEYRCNEENFLKDVAEHQMHILHEDGIYRHVRFKKPNTTAMHFDLITWPGYLCYTGDMGTFVFRRTKDMFEFFRREREDDPNELCINPQYWSEKLEGSDRSDGHREYDSSKFRERVEEQLAEWLEDGELDDEAREELRQAIEDDVLSRADDGEIRAHDAASGFEFEYGGEKYQFHDFWEVDLKRYTNRFIWCCYALNWGIRQYDRSKEVVNG